MYVTYASCLHLYKELAFTQFAREIAELHFELIFVWWGKRGGKPADRTYKCTYRLGICAYICMCMCIYMYM